MAVNQAALAVSMQTALAAVQAAVAAVGNLDTATLVQLQPLKAALASALPTFAAAVSALDGDIPSSTFAGMNPGDPVPAIVLALQTYTSEANQLAVALQAQAYLLRVNANVNAASG